MFAEMEAEAEKTPATTKTPVVAYNILDDPSGDVETKKLLREHPEFLVD
jgi:hypothetical protein